MNDVCKPREDRERIVRDMSWFPECGIQRQVIPWDDHPSIIGNAYGNLLVEANLDCATPFLFRRDGNPIQLVYVGRSATDNRIIVKPLTNAVLRSMLFEVGELHNAKGKPLRGRDSWPSSILEQLMTNLVVDSRIPILKMLVTSPVLTKSGWLERTGFDPESGILARIDPDDWEEIDFLGIGAPNSAEDLKRARSLVEEMFSDVKVPAEGKLATLMSSCLSIVARPLFGNVPLQDFMSGDYGPGKTTTAEAIGHVCLSHGEWTVIPCEGFDGGSPAEMNKRISDSLTSLYRYIVVDDPAEGTPFNHSDLATLLTSPAPVKVRTFGRLGGRDSGTMVYPTQTVCVCGNNTDYSARFTSRKIMTEFDAQVADGRKIKWENPDYLAFIAARRREFNWAVRLLVDEAHRILSSPADRERWELWFMTAKEGTDVRGNYREWFLYTAVIAELLGLDAAQVLGDQDEYETPTDVESEKRDWIVQRLIDLGATDEATSVPAGSLVATDADVAFSDQDSYFGTAEAVSAYLRLHASGKSGTDEDGKAWLIRKAKRKVNKRATWMALATKS